MCDTIFIPASMTKNGAALFAKNSDRDPNEAHFVEIHPRALHTDGEEVQCTYIKIPQAPETNRVLLAKPFWIWGAEMGANEYGVTIGNEAVFTKEPYEKQSGLTGMDLLRLALERGKTATEALKVITDLLEQFGQGGNCSFLHEFYYHNSFLIADPNDAWLLETAGKHWAARHITEAYSISNALSITNQFDLSSKDLILHAIEKGWCRSEDEFDFSRCYSDPFMTYFADGRGRQSCTLMSLDHNRRDFEVHDLMNILRTHRRGNPDEYSPDKGLAGADICMHAAIGPVRINETTGSMVSELGVGEQIHWVTGTAAPCTGIFKPVWIDADLPDIGAEPKGQFTPDTLWWQHEILHRQVILDYVKRMALYKNDRDQLEKEFINGATSISSSALSEKQGFCQSCFAKAAEATSNWINLVKDAPVEKGVSTLYNANRRKFNRLALLPD